MVEHILFLTDKLAEKQSRRTLEEMAPEFRYTVHPLGLTVAALKKAGENNGAQAEGWDMRIPFRPLNRVRAARRADTE